jgi:hypothetical protein
LIPGGVVARMKRSVIRGEAPMSVSEVEYSRIPA